MGSSDSHESFVSLVSAALTAFVLSQRGGSLAWWLRKDSVKTVVLRLVRQAWSCLATLGLVVFQTIGQAHAQNANEMYKDTGNDRRRYEAIQQQNKDIIQGVFYQALQNGQLWRCDNNVYLFFDGRVFVGSKEDTSDMGKEPYNIVGSYLRKNEFITFVFPALPYENTFELNTLTHDLFTFKSTNNKITKTNCKTIERLKK